MPKILLTPKIVKFKDCPDGQRKLDLFDLGCKGLLLELRASGAKTFYLRYVDLRGKQRQFKIADTRDLSLEQARDQADKLRAQIAMGIDPIQERRIIRSTPTLAAFVTESYLPYIKSYKRSSDTDISILKTHILPAFGVRFMDSIERREVASFAAKLIASHKPASVNRVMIVLRFIYSVALRWETPGVKANPCRGVRHYEENNKRERFLTQAEAKALIESVQQSENQSLKYIVAMLILTGARKGEVLQAKWDQFHLEQRSWRIPISKSGKARRVPINDGLLQLLNNMPKWRGSDYLFVNAKTNKPFRTFFNSWNQARKRAGLPDVRVHDIRHSYASFLINNGRSLYEVQRLLGHSQIKTTQRYAHLSPETLLEASNTASLALGDLTGGLPKAGVDRPLVSAQG
jgi:integrase